MNLPGMSGAALCVLLMLPAAASAAETAFSFSGAGQLVCPCFTSGDRIAVVFDLPQSAGSASLVSVGIGWAAQFGVTGQSVEGAVRVHPGTPPDLGPAIWSLQSPVLTMGTMNEFAIDSLSLAPGPFTVVLELANTNAGMIMQPSVVHDGNGCQPGRNFVFSETDGWRDACDQGFTGDWRIQASYVPAEPTGVGAPGNRGLRITGVVPNPFNPETTVHFELPSAMPVTADVWSVRGARVRTLARDLPLPAGSNSIRWDGRNARGRPVSSGVYLIRIRTHAGSIVARAVLVE